MLKALARVNWRYPGFALMLPAILLALGSWQVTRVAGTPGEFEARALRLQASADRLQPIATRDPKTTIRFTGDPVAYTAQDALKRVLDARDELRRDEWIQWARLGTAWVAAVGGGIAVLAALFGLSAVWMGARRGMASRPALVGAFRRVVRVLPPLLGCVALATGIATTAAVLFEVGGAWFLDSFDTGEIKLVLCGLVIAGAAFWYAVNSVIQLRRALGAFTPSPMRVLGIEAGPAEAPGLWDLLRGIAARQGAAVPDHVVLGLTEGFFVTSSQMIVAPERRLLEGSSLYLQATMMPLLSRAEMTAIIAHELAHFTGEDTKYSLHFLPLFASMSRAMDAVTGRQRTRTGMDAAFQPAGILAVHVLAAFDRVVNHWSRQREFEADRASLRVGDGRHAATALLRTGMGAGIIGAALEHLYSRPDRADQDVVGAVLARAGAVGFVDPGRHLEDRQPHPTDTHPPTRQRIEALGIAIDAGLLQQASRPAGRDDTAQAEALFTDWRGMRERLGADLLSLARTQDQEFQAALEEAAGALAAESVPVHERALVAPIALGFIGLLLAGMGLLAGWATTSDAWTQPGDRTFTTLFAVILGGLGLFFLALAASRYRRARSGPFLVVGPLGFECIGIDGVVPWSAITGIRVTVGQAFLTTFGLDPAAPWPRQTGRRWSVKLDRKKQVLVLKGYVPKAMKPQAFLDLLNRALRAHRAREMLLARQTED